MDLQPELAISSGLIRKGSLIAKMLSVLGRAILACSDQVVVLDRFMRRYIEQRGCAPLKISVIPVWPVQESIDDSPRDRNLFRIEHGFGQRIVVMYSGNHSYVHPLDTLLETALLLKSDERFLFVFIGDGVRKQDVSRFKDRHALSNILQLPLQAREAIHLSLGSADYQVVILGDNQVGYTHPNKIYGAMLAGKPIIYIGPSESHVTDILADVSGNISVQHGEAQALANRLKSQAEDLSVIFAAGGRNQEYARAHFSRNRILAQLESLISMR